MAVNQPQYFQKALRVIESCNSASQLPAAEAMFNRYNELEWFFEPNEGYDHEWHTLTLMASLTKKQRELL